MDQHEKDWLRLGQDLRNYQPPGDPSADFAAFQKLQQETSTRPKSTLVFWLAIGALLALPISFLLLPTTAAPQPEEQPVAALVLTETPAPEEATQALSTGSPEDKPGVSELSAETEKVIEIAAINPGPGLNETTTTTTTQEEVTFSDSGPNAKARVRKVTDSGKGVLVAPIIPVPVGFSPGQDLPEVTIMGVSTVSELKQQASLPRITFGGGLSTHWRGEQFMGNIDHGVYVSLGLQQPLGQRFLLDGRIGYRGHNLDLRVFEDDKPWSHYEEKTNEIDASGEEVEYTYLGIVDGYKGIEFSLLLQYQLNRQIILQAGGRYSLPSLAFRRTVHSSRDGDVTAEPSPYHFLANEQPLVKYYDYGAVFGGQYRINNMLSFEAQLHLGMVDLIEDEGERMNRFNHSSSLSLGLRYRLN